MRLSLPRSSGPQRAGPGRRMRCWGGSTACAPPSRRWARSGASRRLKRRRHESNASWRASPMAERQVERDELPMIGGETAVTREGMQSGLIGSAAREHAELQTQYVVAIQRPRNEEKARNELTKACKRPRFAEAALYSYYVKTWSPREKRLVDELIEGSSAEMAREVLRNWGNVWVDGRIASSTRDGILIRAVAIDFQSNARTSSEHFLARVVPR